MASNQFLAVIYFVLVNLLDGLQGQVFINQDVAPQIATPVIKNDNLVTQTVYGFLDFTTTIGNTVMIFSPHSSSVAVTEKSKDVTSNIIIDSKPTEAQNEVLNIKPSKTVDKQPKTFVEKVSSVIHVNPSSKVEIKSSDTTESKVERPIIVSKVQVVEEVKPSSSAPVAVVVQPQIISKVEIVGGEPIIASKVEVVEEQQPTQSVVQMKTDDEPAAIFGNNINEPEYDFLSRQPSEVVEETYKVINLRPSSKFQLKPRSSIDARNKPTKKADNVRPTGLVSKMEGTVVKDGVVTSYETSVIGTYINGKYAQVLQSTSHIVSQPKAKIVPSQSLRILKTAAPSLKNNKKQHLDPTPVASTNDDTTSSPGAADHNSIKSTRKPGKRFKNRQKEQETSEQRPEKDMQQQQQQQQQPNYKKSSTKNRTPSRNLKQNTSTQRQNKSGRGNRKTRNRKSKSTTSTTPHANSEEPTTTPSGKRYSGSRRSSSRASSATTNEDRNNPAYSRKGYKPRIQISTVDQAGTASTSLYKFKLNRTPGRWQYKTTAKPRVAIVPRGRQIDEPDNFGNETLSSNTKLESSGTTPQQRSDDVDSLEGSESIATVIDDANEAENRVDVPSFPLETLKVEISTPPDFKDVYYEIATIKSPYVFQAGNVKNTRYITVTSTFEKSLESTTEASPSLAPTEPLTENILASTSNYAKDNNLDSSIVTLPPIYLASDVATPPLEILTETFSTTQTMLKTHILPVIRSVNDTTSSTLVQTYLITRLVTATKTLPPMEAYHFNPTKTLNEFNSRLDEAGSELHLELEFGDSNEHDEDVLSRKILPADLDLANIGTDFKLPETDKAKIEKELKNRRKVDHQMQSQQNLSPDQLQQLALLRLLNPAAANQGQVITTSKPVLKVETLYETHVLPVTQGHNTILSTISKIKGTFTKTDYEFGTSTIPPAFPPQIPQIPQIPQLPQIPQINPLLPQPQFTVTSSPIVQNIIVTQTNSKILKLTFGARTALTTVFSTTVVPTVVTSYMTASVPVVAPTAAFPGYYPPAYPAYPYVG